MKYILSNKSSACAIHHYQEKFALNFAIAIIYIYDQPHFMLRNMEKVLSLLELK